MLNVTPIPAFNDNYLWLFHAEGSRQCGIVDPGDAEPVLRHLTDYDLELAVIFITHHHGDHTGGIGKLLQAFDVPVYGPDSSNIHAVTRKLGEGDTVNIFGETFRVLEIPGHTLDHIAYFAEGNPPILFCGDTLFAGGCGRVFEGTHRMMYGSLQKLAVLPPDTMVYCAHEYTLANLAFAHAVTPDSAPLADRMSREKARREEDMPTVPTTIRAELETNPFLRCTDADIIAAAHGQSGRLVSAPDEVFGIIRSWKDSF
jgi:hydroxyacylglutathione hydrolase